MTITLLVQWYDRKPDFTPDYDKPHTGRIEGSTPDECMHKYMELSRNHDLARYTRIEIICVC